MINGMTVKMDKAGRIVLPKPVRERLRLRPGSRLKVEESAGGILLRPVKQRASLIQKQGLLVHRGEAAGDLDWSRMVDDQREERKRAIAKLVPSRPAAPSRRPDFLARLKKVYGERQAKVSGAELVARDRGRC